MYGLNNQDAALQILQALCFKPSPPRATSFLCVCLGCTHGRGGGCGDGSCPGIGRRGGAGGRAGLRAAPRAEGRPAAVPLRRWVGMTAVHVGVWVWWGRGEGQLGGVPSTGGCCEQCPAVAGHRERLGAGELLLGSHMPACGVARGEAEWWIPPAEGRGWRMEELLWALAASAVPSRAVECTAAIRPCARGQHRLQAGLRSVPHPGQVSQGVTQGGELLKTATGWGRTSTCGGGPTIGAAVGWCGHGCAWQVCGIVPLCRP